ncbi:MAG: DUF4468 domain-containing protein [Alloprevotella sp.]|nr:DUF4468 domain-containing protein [Bacteroidales bacterium]MDY3944283.1 DUF4468 domain-containing protein [Alloprevotella sp.]
MKYLLFLFLFVATLGAPAQTAKKYLAGAVPTENGYVQFSKTYNVPGKSRTEIFNSLLEYTKTEIVGGAQHLNQSRITDNNVDEGIIVASMEEFLYFKRTAMVSHGTRFFYQLIFQIEDGAFTVEMRRIHYIYDGVDGTTSQAQNIRAEDWITDNKALNKNGQKLNRTSGKFRKATIDRKDEIFRQAAIASGAEVKTKVVVVDE